MLNVKNKVVFLLTFLALSLSFSAQAEEQAIALLNRDLSKSMKTMQESTRLYTYFNVAGQLSTLDSLQKRNSLMQRFFANSLMQFWNLESTATKNINAGLGLYAAIDPHVSRSYGNVFTEIGIAQGTKYLDVYSPILVGKDTIAALIKEDLILRNEINAILIPSGKGRYAFSRDTLRAMVKPEFKEFRKVVQRIFLTNKLVMLEYNWESSLPGFCRMNRASAFVIVGAVVKNAQGVSQIQESFSKTLISETGFPNQTELEKQTTQRVLKFKTMLSQMTAKGTYAQKVKVVNTHYADADEKLAVFDSTYSCER